MVRAMYATSTVSALSSHPRSTTMIVPRYCCECYGTACTCTYTVARETMLSRLAPQSFPTTAPTLEYLAPEIPVPLPKATPDRK